MTSRERILAAVAHRQPDSVPVDLGATPSSGISAIAYSRLKQHLGISEGYTSVYDVVQQLAQPEDFILDLFHIDVVDVGSVFNTRSADWYDAVLPGGTQVQFPRWFRPRVQPDGHWDVFAANGERIATMPPTGAFFDQTCFPYLNGYPADDSGLPSAMARVHWAALAVSPWDHAARPDFWQLLRERTLILRQITDKAIVIGAGCNLFEWGTFLRRLDNFLVDLIEAPDEVDRLLDALMEVHLATLQKVCEAVGDVADIIRFGDDLGMDTGPLMAPEIYRRHFKPRHAMLCDYVHQHSKMHTFLHSCGSIYRLLPDLIDAGFEILNPVQTSCRDMEPDRLKKEFGRDITFWGGGCDTRTVLNHGTPAQVRDHVRERLDIFMPGGGYVFNTVHNILPDVPPENIVAMYQAISDWPGA